MVGGEDGVEDVLDDAVSLDPGETREEFNALQSFLEEVQLDRVGVFRYSQEPGTPAATLPSQVPARVI